MTNEQQRKVIEIAERTDLNAEEKSYLIVQLFASSPNQADDVLQQVARLSPDIKAGVDALIEKDRTESN